MTRYRVTYNAPTGGQRWVDLFANSEEEAEALVVNACYAVPAYAPRMVSFLKERIYAAQEELGANIARGDYVTQRLVGKIAAYQDVLTSVELLGMPFLAKENT